MFKAAISGATDFGSVDHVTERGAMTRPRSRRSGDIPEAISAVSARNSCRSKTGSAGWLGSVSSDNRGSTKTPVRFPWGVWMAVVAPDAGSVVGNASAGRIMAVTPAVASTSAAAASNLPYGAQSTGLARVPAISLRMMAGPCVTADTTSLVRPPRTNALASTSA